MRSILCAVMFLSILLGTVNNSVAHGTTCFPSCTEDRVDYESGDMLESMLSILKNAKDSISHRGGGIGIVVYKGRCIYKDKLTVSVHVLTHSGEIKILTEKENKTPLLRFLYYATRPVELDMNTPIGGIIIYNTPGQSLRHRIRIIDHRVSCIPDSLITIQIPVEQIPAR